MALAISVGFVVDDAIVMIENMYRNLEQGMNAVSGGARRRQADRLHRCCRSALSLVAAFIPLIFMDGVVGRLLREFSLTLIFAIVVSTVVSLTVTPMICAHYIQGSVRRRPGDLVRSRGRRRTLSRIDLVLYEGTLRVVLGFPFLTLLVFSRHHRS